MIEVISLSRNTQIYEFSFLDGRGTIVWNIDQAKKEIEAGNWVHEEYVAREELAIIAKQYEYTESHVDEVNTEVPGIAMPVLHTDGSGYYVIADGLHRAVKAHRYHLPFKIRCLSLEAAARCLLMVSAPGLVPLDGAPE